MLYLEENAISLDDCSKLDPSHYTPAPPRFSTPRKFFEALFGDKCVLESRSIVLDKTLLDFISLQDQLVDP